MVFYYCKENKYIPPFDGILYELLMYVQVSSTRQQYYFDPSRITEILFGNSDDNYPHFRCARDIKYATTKHLRERSCY